MALRLEPAPGGLSGDGQGIVWLGQAGFWVDTGAHRILIDPYLSDSLARKYAGTKHPHVRMMLPPATVDTLPKPDIVLVTHAHTDHMDPGTLSPLADRFPDLPFIVPEAERAKAEDRIGADAHLIGTTAGEVLAPLPGLVLTVLPAAHEERIQDTAGQDRFLGYGISAEGLRLVHPGDTVPLDALSTALEAYAPDIMLMPVNGRDAERLADGVPGNTTLAEAVEMSDRAGASVMVAHHWGMFDFNTIDPEEIDAAAETAVQMQIIRPEPGVRLRPLR